MKPEDAKRYALYQGSQKIVENSTGVFEKIDVSKFTEGGGCFVRVTDADGKFADTNINLQFARNSVNENTEIKLKSSALSLKISDDIPYLGGTTLKFDLPLQAPVVFPVRRIRFSWCESETERQGIKREADKGIHREN